MFACELSELAVGPPGGSSVRPAKSTSSLHQSASADRLEEDSDRPTPPRALRVEPPTGRTTRLQAEPDVCQASRKAAAAMAVTMHRLRWRVPRRLRRSARTLRRAGPRTAVRRFRVAFSTTATVAGSRRPRPTSPRRGRPCRCEEQVGDDHADRAIRRLDWPCRPRRGSPQRRSRCPVVPQVDEGVHPSQQVVSTVTSFTTSTGVGMSPCQRTRDERWPGIATGCALDAGNRGGASLPPSWLWPLPIGPRPTRHDPWRGAGEDL